ncbi:DUF4823 domain-containing protein [Paraburkholderia dipogonis]|uniref:DUF4823 domain-containing protein n=1 Tax=Paraburkholderia dipogonis TaxID=1211383 RepID=UPI0038BB4DC6
MKIWIAAACIALAGCTASYQKQDLAGSGAIPTQLSPSSRVYVALPADGAYEDKTYPGSGRTAAQAVAAAFAKHGSAVTIADVQAGRDQTITAAQAAGARYAAIPVISHWEPRATEWSGRPSRMAITLSMVDVPSGTTVSNIELSGRSRIMSFTSTSPESLLREPVQNYIDSLYPR